MTAGSDRGRRQGQDDRHDRVARTSASSASGSLSPWCSRARSPQVAAAWQFLLAACHCWRNHYGACAPVFPRTAVLIPAWNEGR